MTPIILWELKQRRMYALAWAIGVLAIVATLLLLYPSIHHQASQLNDILGKLPPALRDLKTGGTGGEITSPTGFLNSQVFYATLPLFYIIMSIGLGGSLLARDEQNHTLELLLARPISRSRILGAKAIAGSLTVLLVAAVATIAMMLLAPAVDITIPAQNLLLANLVCAVFSLSFGAIAFALTAASTRTRQAGTAIATIISLAGYLLASLSGLTHFLKTPATLLPYHYYSPAQILAGHLSIGLCLYLAAIFAVSASLGWAGFCRRDIY